jgi:hypothetical protein
MNRTNTKNRILMSSVVFLITLLPVLSYAYSMGDIDNLVFLYMQGSDSRPITKSELKGGVNKYKENPLSELSGYYEFTYIGYEAVNINTLNNDDETIFTNKSTSALARYTLDIDDVFFKDTIDGPPYVSIKGEKYLSIYSLDGGLLNEYLGLQNVFENGCLYYVVGFGDGLGDYDYDDLVVVVKGPTVPLPSTLLLLLSGITGLTIYRRRRNENG